MNKKAAIAFLGNPDYDTRVTNLYRSLKREELSVSVIGFDWQSENFTPQKGEVTIHKLTKSKPSIFFYLAFFFRLFFFMIKGKYDYYFAEDVYTLPLVTLIGKMKGGKVYYESRELYQHIGGLRDKPFVQKLIANIENHFIHKVDLVITTGEMDSEFLEEHYGLANTLVLRNLPLVNKPGNKKNYRTEFNIPEEGMILLYQGVLHEGRGISFVFDIMASVQGLYFVILGDGPFKEKFMNEAKQLGIADRVFFMGNIPQPELINYTAGGDIGISLIENISVSYYYALPNKLFEYIMAGLPVLCSNLPQMDKVVNEYDIGKSIDIGTKEETAAFLIETVKYREMLNKYKDNCTKAAAELNWESEFEKAKKVLLS